MKRVAFCGIEGSGKTTAVRYLLEYQVSDRRKRKVWFRWRAFLTFILYLYAKLRRLTYSYKDFSVYQDIKVHEWHGDIVLDRLYPYFLIFDMILFYLAEVAYSLLRNNDLLVFDRFFLDALADIAWELKRTTVLQSLPAVFVYRLVKKVDSCIILDVDPTLSLQRKKDGSLLEELEFKRDVYHFAARHSSLPIVDTSNKSISDVCGILVNVLRDCGI